MSSYSTKNQQPQKKERGRGVRYPYRIRFSKLITKKWEQERSESPGGIYFVCFPPSTLSPAAPSQEVFKVHTFPVAFPKIQFPEGKLQEGHL